MQNNKYNHKLFNNIIVFVLIPMILLLSVYAYYNYKKNLRVLESHVTAKNQNLKKEIKDLLAIMDETSNYSEDIANSDLKSASDKFILAYKESNGSIIYENVDSVCKRIGVNDSIFEIYYLDTILVVRNSNNKKEIGFQLGAYKNKYKKYFDTIFDHQQFVSDRSANAESDNRLRKYSYQATYDKKYIIELSLFPKKYKRIIVDFVQHINKLVSTQKSISKIGLYFSSERLIPLDSSMEVRQNQKEIFMKCMHEKNTQSISEIVDGEKVNYEYTYLKMDDATFVDGWVMQVISTNDEIENLESDEFKKFLKQLAIYIIPLILLLFILFRRVLNPIESMVETMDEIKNGDISKRINIKSKNELGNLANHFNTMMDKEQKNLEELEEKVNLRTVELKISNEKLAKQNAEREMLIREIHHRVKNNLHMVNSMLRLQSNTIDDKKTLNALQDLQDRIMTMSNLHEFMFKNRDLGNYLSTKEYISRIVSETDKTYKSDIIKKYHIDVDDFQVKVEDLLPFGLMLTELITNSHKYAFEGKPLGNIYVTLKSSDTIHATFEFGDDGIGYDSEAIESTSLGITLIESFAEQLNGKLLKLEKPGSWFQTKLEFSV
jgi:two-component sensor histidine kinase/HAMP domain-containing protein